MISLQAINKILNTKDFSLVTANAFDRNYFSPYQEEFDFINNHFNTYGNVPDKETFLFAFPEFQNFDVAESDEYLAKGLVEEHLYSCAVPIIEKSAEILKGNSIDAVDYLMGQLPKLNKQIGISAIDIIHRASERFDAYEKKRNGEDDKFYISTGFNELDYAIHGWSRGEELVVLFARTNQGKSWILTKLTQHAWRTGETIGFVSPEMSATKIGYRFDTLYKHFDNSALNWGKEVDGYADYIRELDTSDANFFVATPKDFGNKITVSKLKTFAQNYDIDMLAIDGMSYLSDEKSGKYDNQQAQLTHISEDLFQLSSELGIPIIVVVQANRDGVKLNGGNLELENIRDADGISYNASKVIAIRQKVDEDTLELTVKKNRDGAVGGKFIYQWLPNTGDFRYIPSEEDGNEVDRAEKTEELRQRFEPKGGIVF